jgi:hypothetical protein
MRKYPYAHLESRGVLVPVDSGGGAGATSFLIRVCGKRGGGGSGMVPVVVDCAREVPVVVPVVVDRGGGSGGEGVVVMPRHLQLAFVRGR